MNDERREFHTDPAAAAEMAANVVVGYLRDCHIEGYAEKKHWIDLVHEKVIAKELSQ